MARTVINMARTGPWAQRWAVRLSLVLIVAAGLFFVRTVLAVHDTGAFELEGNAVNDPLVDGDDWDNVCHEVDPTECQAASNTTNGIAASWTSDNLLDGTPSLQATIFTGGGSKDPQDISGTGNGENFWAWKDGAGGLPDKDNLLHSFAVRYSLDATEPGPNGPGTCPNGTGDMDGDGNNPEVDDPTTPVDEGEVVFDPDLKCELLYFGSDRFDNSGDAQQGFWFLQDQIGLTNVKSGGGFKFSGVHTPGDLLVISEFSNGGDKSTIRVFVWDPTVSGNLRLLDESTAANCATSPEGDPFCGIVSGLGLTSAPWSFLDKSGNTNFANGELFEAGVNLSLLGLAGECFASVLSETRASTSTTATLKDFVLGSFANCVPGLTTQVSATGAVAPGTPVTDLATVLVTGGDNPPDPTGGVTFFLCGPGANGGTPNCDGTTGNVGTQIGTAVTLSNPACNPVSPNDTDGLRCARSLSVNDISQTGARGPLAAGIYCFRAEWPGDTTYPGPFSHTNTTTECFTVSVISTTTTTAQDWLPNDTGTVTAGSATKLNGSLKFTLHAGGNCTGSVLRPTETITITNLDSPVTRSTTNGSDPLTAVKVLATATVSWKVEWDSTDAGVADSSHCQATSLTINNLGTIP